MKNKFYIGLVSLLVVILVLISILYKPDEVQNNTFLKNLPLFNALMNGLSFISLISAYFFIKKKNIKFHVGFIIAALTFTLLFLISYLLYHFSNPPTSFGGEGIIKIIYLTILSTHIILAAFVVPLVLLTISEAFNKNYIKHKKFAKISLPIWLYVSFTGVIIYLMNRPYY